MIWTDSIVTLSGKATLSKVRGQRQESQESGNMEMQKGNVEEKQYAC